MKILLTLFVLFFSTSVISNDNFENPIKYPIPEITNYPPSINGGYTATWGITQDNEGKIYFASHRCQSSNDLGRLIGFWIG